MYIATIIEFLCAINRHAWKDLPALYATVEDERNEVNAIAPHMRRCTRCGKLQRERLELVDGFSQPTYKQYWDNV